MSEPFSREQRELINEFIDSRLTKLETAEGKFRDESLPGREDSWQLGYFNGQERVYYELRKIINE